MPRYTGSCHCGAVKFEIDAVINRVIECNCSVCSKKGILHHRVDPEHFRLLSGAEQLGTYQFGTMTAKHHFCTVCGVAPFTRPRVAPHLYTINVRCLDDFDLDSIRDRIGTFDGRNWEEAVKTLK